MARFGILGRLLLILLSALLALSATNLLILRWQDVHHTRPAPFLRVRQFAADADLLAATPATSRPALLRALRALGDQLLRLKVEDRAPDLTGFIHAPRLEAKLHGFAHTSTGAATQVYTSASQANRSPLDKVEGFMALAVTKLPDGAYLSATPNLQSQGGQPTLFGAPTALWIGLSGAVVAVLAVYGAIRELRPLRRLAGSLDAFTGAVPNLSSISASAPEVRALTAATEAMQHRVSELMRERTIMIGAVAHDLRTLLTRMQLRLLTLADEAVQARFSADLDAMSKLIEDALAFARGVDAKLTRCPLDLSDLVATEIAEREALGASLPIQTMLSTPSSKATPRLCGASSPT